MPVYNFAVLSVIVSGQNIPTPHISRTHLLIVSLNLREFQWN